MPIVTKQRRYAAPTVHACRAVVAVRERWPERADAYLRHLRVLIMGGEMADDSDTFELAAERTGLPVRELAAHAGTPEVEAALQADARAARGRRCPSIELAATGAELTDEALEPLTPRPEPAGVDDVLAWAPYPLATVEVAAICRRGVREELDGELPRAFALSAATGTGRSTERRPLPHAVACAASMVSVVACLIGALVLLAAACLKLADGDGSRAALATYGLRGEAAARAWAALVAVELALAVGVGAGIDGAAWGAAALMAVFAVRPGHRADLRPGRRAVRVLRRARLAVAGHARPFGAPHRGLCRAPAAPARRR
jgi:hypothetical protein